MNPKNYQINNKQRFLKIIHKMKSIMFLQKKRKASKLSKELIIKIKSSNLIRN